MLFTILFKAGRDAAVAMILLMLKLVGFGI